MTETLWEMEARRTLKSQINSSTNAVHLDMDHKAPEATFGVAPDGTLLAMDDETVLSIRVDELEQEVERLRELVGDLVTTLEIAETRPEEAIDICRKEGFVFDGEQGRWQKLAFTFYTALASDAGNASRSIVKAKRALE